MSSLSEREKEIRVRLKEDYPHYAERCLKIRPKDPRLGNVPLILNKAQRYAHDRFEKQREETGKVRALVLKGRQQGLSTNIGGRFYHRVTHSKGIRCFILTHEQDATDNLFGMVERFHDNCPAIMRPHTGASNAKELYFDKLDSGYAVGTAGSKAVGRSQTIQLFHGSEVAFWPNAPAHFAGVVQAVPDLPGTEIILESTANGLGGEFHERWQQAEAGLSDYIAIFVPWFWDEGYRREVPSGFQPSEDEINYMETYGLHLEQIVWRRAKMSELKDPMLFKQEYPATAAEAFQSTGHDSYIKPEKVLAARKAVLAGIGPLILGADPCRFGNDRFSLARRQGRKVLKIDNKQKIDNVAGANWLKQVTDEEKPARGFIDVGGQGAGVFDILKSWGYAFDASATTFDPKAIWVPVDFGGSPQQRDIFLPNGEQRPGPWNRRAEMWMRSKEWLDEPGGADIPDEDGLQADACGPGYHYNTNSYLLLESKEHMRDVRKLRSPDDWDAVALTFAEPVAANVVPTEWTFGAPAVSKGWMGV